MSWRVVALVAVRVYPPKHEVQARCVGGADAASTVDLRHRSSFSDLGIIHTMQVSRYMTWTRGRAVCPNSTEKMD